MFSGPTKELRFSFFFFSLLYIGHWPVWVVSGGQPKSGRPKTGLNGPERVSHRSNTKPAHSLSPRVQKSKSASGMFLRLLSQVTTCGWCLVVFAPHQIQKRARSGRFGLILDLGVTHDRAKCLPVRLKSCGSVFSSFLSYILVLDVSWLFGGFSLRFGPLRANFGDGAIYTTFSLLPTSTRYGWEMGQMQLCQLVWLLAVQTHRGNFLGRDPIRSYSSLNILILGPAGVFDTSIRHIDYQYIDII